MYFLKKAKTEAKRFPVNKKSHDITKADDPRISNKHDHDIVCERDLVIQVIEKEEQFNQLEDQWNKLVSSSEMQTSIFQSYDWQRVWWHHFGEENKLKIVTIWFNGLLVALAPLYENRIKLFNGNWYRKLEFIGNRVPDSKGLFYDYSPTDYLDFIIDKSFKSKVVSKLTDWLIGKLLEYDEVLLDELPADGVFYENLLPELEKKDVNIKQIRKEICYQIDLKGIDTIDDYLSSLSRKQRYELRYSKKAVLKKKLFEIEKARNEEQVIDFFNELVSMHQERWNKLGYPGIFYDSRVYNFLRDITLACHKRGSLRFKRAVEKENNSLALDLAFSFNDVIYDYQKALDSDHKLAKYGPGNALLYFLIEDGINTGYSKIDLMRGGERYKRRVSNSSSYNWEVSLKSATKCNKKGQKIYELQNQLDQILRKGKRELSLLNIQIMQNGWIKSIPSYYSFLKKRLQNS